MRSWLPRPNNSEPNRQSGCPLCRVFDSPPNRGGCAFVYALSTKLHHQPNQDNSDGPSRLPNSSTIGCRHSIASAYEGYQHAFLVIFCKFWSFCQEGLRLANPERQLQAAFVVLFVADLLVYISFAAKVVIGPGPSLTLATELNFQ